MTEIKTGEAVSYTLPLESVDLTYLSKYVQNSRDEKMPLWSKKCLDGESEYYQIKIVAKDVNEDDCYSEPSDIYKCHVCNLDVPKTCFKEHNESKIHETYKNIFSKVLERVSKQIELVYTTNDGDINKDAYYCITCSKIVKIRNKYHHEASSYHIKSQENINILSNFYEIFKDDEKEIITESIKENKYNYVDENERALKSNKDNLVNDIENNNSRGLTSKNCNKMVDTDDDISMTTEPNVENDETNSETNLETVIIDKEMSLEEKIKTVIAKYNLNVELVIDGEFIHISTPHGKIRVSHENFHSYRHIKDYTYCRMCKTWISQDTRAHEATETHLINILKPVNDKFERAIDTISIHCIVCNEVVLILSDHYTKENHEKILLDKNIANNSQNNGIKKNVSSKQTNSKDNDKLNEYYKLFTYTDNTETIIKCSICDVIVNYNDRNVIEHIEGRSHKDVVNKQKMGDYHKLLVFTDDAKSQVKCCICDVNIPFVKRNILKHMKGKRHEDEEKELIKFHHIVKLASQYHCKCCVADLNITNILDHIDSKTHTDNFQEIYVINKVAMRKAVYDYETNYDDLAPYMRGLYDSLLINNDINQVNDTKFHCKMCDIYLSRFNEIDHMLGERHGTRKIELRTRSQN